MTRTLPIFCAAAVALLSTAGCADPYSLSLLGAASPSDAPGSSAATLRLDRVVPDRGSQANADDVVVRAKFSAALAADQIAAHWLVATTAGVSIPGEVAIDPAEPATLTFRPASRWPSGATISVAVSAAITAAGGATAQAESWSFSIRPASTSIVVGPSQRIFAGAQVEVGQMRHASPGDVALLFDTADHGNCAWWTSTGRSWSPVSSLPLWPSGAAAPIVGRAGDVHVLEGTIRSFPRNGGATVTAPSSSFVPSALVRMSDGAATAWSALAFPANPVFASSDWNDSASVWQQNPVTATFAYGPDAFVTALPVDTTHVDYIRRAPDGSSFRIEADRRDRSGVAIGGTSLLATVATFTRIVPCASDGGMAGLMLLEPTAQGTRVSWVPRGPAGWLSAEVVSTVIGARPETLLVDAAVADSGAVVAVIADSLSFGYEGWIRSGAGTWRSSVGSLGSFPSGVACAVGAQGDGLVVARDHLVIEARGVKSGTWSGPTRVADGAVLANRRVAAAWAAGSEFLVSWSSSVSSTVQAVDAAPIAVQ